MGVANVLGKLAVGTVFATLLFSLMTFVDMQYVKRVLKDEQPIEKRSDTMARELLSTPSGVIEEVAPTGATGVKKGATVVKPTGE